MTIYNSEGVVIYEAPITKSTIIKRVLMGDYYIELSSDAVDRIDVGRGSYILYNGQKFEIMDNVLPEDTNTGGLRYTLRFKAQQSQMKRCKVFWRDDANLEVSFSNTTSLSQFGSLIVKNVNAFLGGNNWSLGSYPQDLEKTLKTISFNGDFCWDAVNNIAETFGVEWWTKENGDNVSLCFGKLEHGEEVEFRRGEIVSSIPSKRGDSSNYGTRFYVFGSTKNLPEDYSSTTEGGITNHIVEKRLHLPDGINYIDAWPNIKQEDIVEQVVFFDDIFPTNVDTITNINTKYEEIVEGLSGQVYSVYCEDTPFTIDNIIDGEQIQATFTSGELSGQTFDIEVNQSTSDKWFRIVPNILDADSGTYIPNARTLKPQIGDTFILTGIILPEGRTKEAEQLLLEAGTEYAQKNSNDTEVYDCPTNAIYCHNNDCNFSLGQRVKLIGDKFKGGRSSRIQGYEKRLYDEYQAVYTVGDNSAYSRLGAVEKAIQKSEYSDRTGLEANLIRSKSDNTIPSDYNVYSALATEKYFLNKNKGGVVKGKTDFDGGLSILGQDIIYDPVKKAWEFKGDFVVTGAITMFGSLSGFQPSTVTEAVEVDGETIVKTKNSQGQWQLTAIGRGGGTGGGISAAEVNILIENALKPYALSTSIPTDNKQLSNGAGYATVSDLDTRINNLINGAPAAYDTLKEIADVLAGNINSIGDILTALDTKAAKTYVDGELAKYILKDTAQDISARHNFVNGLQIGGLPITKSASANNTIYLDANLVVSGAITMFGTGSTTFPTIWANIPFNIKHMSWDGSQWNIKGGGGSGSLDTNAVNVLISEYLTKNSYATISDISSALVGYATQSWVGDNYLSKSGGTITGASGALTIARRDADQIGILFTGASGDLGLIGFSSSDTPAYIKYDGNAYPILHSGNYTDYFTKSNIKSTLGISDWALAATKPSYTAAEVGALGVNGTAQSALKMTPEYLTDLNSAAPWRFFDMNTGYGSADGNKPNIAWVSGITGMAACSSNYRWQLAATTGNARPYFRQESKGNWSNWNALAFTSDIPTKLSQLTDDVVAGKYLKSTIYGNFDADTLFNDGFHSGNILHLPSGSPWGIVHTLSYRGGSNNAKPAYATQIFIPCGDDSTSPNDMFFRTSLADAWNAWNKVITDKNIGDYNAGSATKLQTPRSIWGQSFDGNGDISGLLTNVDGIQGSTTNGGYIGDRNKGLGATDGGSMIYNYSPSPITFHINGSESVRILPNGNMAIGDVSADAKLHVHGDILATGAITMFSQLSMKNVLDYDGLSLAQLAQIKPARFTWKDGRDTLVHAGGIADEVMQVLPEVVHRTKDCKLTMDYGSAGFYVGASLIKPVIDHEKRIEELEREVEYLRNENKQLRVS